MKAVVLEQFGPPEVLQVKDMPKPGPKDNEILVRVHATTVNYGDLVARDFKHLPMREFNMPGIFWLIARVAFGLNKPNIKVLGNEFSGEVEQTGKDVTRFKTGDQVIGYLGQKMGAYAEYLCIPEDGVVTHKPASLSHQEAPTILMGGITALYILSQQHIQPGDKILVLGASGSIGSSAVQIAARVYGAQVTGVCSTPRVNYVKSLGAEKVIDYRKEDFTRSGETYDIIFDILGRHSFAQVKGSLKPKGRYLLASFKLDKIMQMLWTKITGGKQVICAMAPQTREDLLALMELVEAGKVKPSVDKVFPMTLAAEAHRYAESGQKKGNVVISFL